MASRSVAFGPFELRLDSATLKKDGRPVKLPPQPAKLLALLVERGGEVVTREAIQASLWPDGTFVDFDQSINFCVKRIREVLGDDAETPRFVETVPRIGYRFVGTIVDDAEAPPPRRGRGKWGIGAAIGLGVLAAALGRRDPADTILPTTRPFTALEGDEGMPSFSPDGRQIAYVWNGSEDGFYHVFVKMIAGGEPLQLTSAEADDFHPAWSPDGTTLAFLRASEGAYELLTIPAIGGNERLFGTSAFMTRPAWHPDGEHIALGDDASPPRALDLIALSTGERRNLTAPDERHFDRGGAFSPDGTELAFVRTRRGVPGQDIYIQLTDGGDPRRLTFGFRPIGGFAWTPDGTHILFSATLLLSFEAQLFKVRATGGEPVRLAFGHNAEVVAIAPDGRRLAYEQQNRDLNIWRVGGPTALVPTPPSKFLASTRDDWLPVYSPDGSEVAFLSNRAGDWQVWVADADGTRARMVAGPAGPAKPSWAPSGTEIAYSASTETDHVGVYSVSLRGGPARNLTPGERLAFSPAWSHDGAWVFFETEGPQGWRVSKVSSAGGDAIPLSGADNARHPIAARERIFFMKSFRVWSASVDGEDEEALPLARNVGYWLWTVWDERIVYVRHDRPAIEIFDPGTGDTRQVASLEGTNLAGGLTVSPDGKWILYVQDDGATGRDIMRVENIDP
jgi:Tol biopolymer transport system component/DNA-binding winged helix-turn-helix (wHTH) protein